MRGAQAKNALLVPPATRSRSRRGPRSGLADQAMRGVESLPVVRSRFLSPFCPAFLPSASSSSVPVSESGPEAGHNSLRRRLRAGCLSFFSAFSSICLIRSRVISKVRLIFSKVSGLFPSSPKRRLKTLRSRGDSCDRTLSKLSPRERSVLRRRFGLDGKRPETLEKISRTFDITRERIRQIEEKALKKLRHPARRRLLRELWPASGPDSETGTDDEEADGKKAGQKGGRKRDRTTGNDSTPRMA